MQISNWAILTSANNKMQKVLCIIFQKEIQYQLTCSYCCKPHKDRELSSVIAFSLQLVLIMFEWYRENKSTFEVFTQNEILTRIKILIASNAIEISETKKALEKIINKRKSCDNCWVNISSFDNRVIDLQEIRGWK